MHALSVYDIARACEGELHGDGTLQITGANTLEEAGPHDLGFVAHQRSLKAAQHTKAGCLLVQNHLAWHPNTTHICVADARRAFAQLLGQLFPTPEPSRQIHPGAIVSSSAIIGDGVTIEAYAVVGEGTTIEDGCIIRNHVSIGDDVFIGKDSELKPHVVIYNRVRIGRRALLHAGAVIGADGFGFALAGDRYEKFPQIGIVEIGDDVEIGSNACVDRAALGATRVGNGTKLDNMVHIGHNCQIGNHVVMAAQTGLSGGVKVGDYAVFGGQVGVSDRVTIAPKAIIGAQAGILPDRRVTAGEPVWGTPARPLKQHLRGLAHVNRLEQYRRQLQAVEQRLNELESRPSGGEG